MAFGRFPPSRLEQKIALLKTTVLPMIWKWPVFSIKNKRDRKD